MKNTARLEERKRIWIVLSDLYLDTELGDSDFKYMALAIFKSPYTFEEAKEIDKYEIFPVLFSNLLSPAGEWAGFNEKILTESIIQWIDSKSPLDILAIQCVYPVYEWINKEYWEKIKTAYNQIEK
ncbi:hypothetical protein HNP38_002006 [Chryseobacterium defluvii]|uniref:DUF7079 domain-containing protein n=1 Tax=Chryseobacterium defluvii TaxID=160396 RepID=A0A840KGS6_9FLAO|nr:hypothetical protein [Chryseobacterium defluvii]MBB4806710.1 hypothetical protein [Chryseobacterium defluvii]